jgi:hypothetical protein
MENIFHYSDKQIPAAEHEAEQIASGVKNAKTPEDVKSALGESMGADFSTVRFHSDASAARKADDIGARAYTMGRDVYFDGEGFDPAVAAHELVHTTQQGSVHSEAPTVTAPMGGVQMLGNPFKFLRNLFRGGSGGNTTATARPGPAELDTEQRDKVKQLKGVEAGGTVVSMPTAGKQPAVVKTTTNPALESALAEFYNTAGGVHSKRTKSERGGWSYGAPEARGLAAGTGGVDSAEQAGIKAMYADHTLANMTPRRADEGPLTPDQLADSTTVYSSASGMSVGDMDPNRQTSTIREKLQAGKLHAGVTTGADAPGYRRMMGNVALMDMVTGNTDRLHVVNPENWMEDRKKKHANLIDNAFDLEHALGRGTREDWRGVMRGKVGGGTREERLARVSGGMMVANEMGAPEGLYGPETQQGLSSGLSDLPQVRANFAEKLAARRASGSIEDAEATHMEELLGRMDELSDMFDPEKDAAAMAAPTTVAPPTVAPPTAAPTTKPWQAAHPAGHGIITGQLAHRMPAVPPVATEPATTLPPEPAPADTTGAPTGSAPGVRQLQQRFETAEPSASAQSRRASIGAGGGGVRALREKFRR